MKKIILDKTFWCLLANLKEPVDLCDEAGSVLGSFVPLSEIDLLRQSEPQLSEEEFLKIEQEPEISTAELLAQLGKL